ncbi:MAG: Ig-like domain-containing protein [Clostridia bacterium]|nr:Ig-like domain-containing protein [Clostridia bacterium]
MKRTKEVLLILLVALISILPMAKVNAYTGELDSEGEISLPMFIWGNEGTITISSSVTNYTLYYQPVEVTSEIENQIDTLKKDGEAELEKLKEKYKALEQEVEALQTAYNESKTDEAYEKYKAKYDEYKAAFNEHNDKVNEINTKIKELTPSYNDSNWIKTDDGKFSIDVSQFSGDKTYVIWVKLVKADGTIAYDEGMYTTTGSKAEEINIESISLNKTTLSLLEGEISTLTPTITPSDATNTTITWTSDNEAVATVKDGKVTAIAEGTAKITATANEGKVTATCEVTVTKKVTSQETPKQEESSAEQKEEKPDGIPEAGSNSIVYISIITTLAIIGIVTYKKVKNLDFK